MIDTTLSQDIAGTASETPAAADSLIQESPPSRAKKLLRAISWIGLVLVLIVFFTILKFPDEKIKSYIQGSLNAYLSDMGYTLSARESKLSLLLGVSYTLQDVTLYPPAPTPMIHVDKMSISPSLLGMLFKKMGGSISLNNGEGRLNSSFSYHPSGASQNFSIDLSSQKLDLRKLGILPLALQLNGGALLQGDLEFQGDLNTLPTWKGQSNLKFLNFQIDSQSTPQSAAQPLSIKLPTISISEIESDLFIDKGKFQIRKFSLGKSDQDDIRGNIQGDFELAKSFEASRMNLKIKLSVSDALESLLKNMSFLFARFSKSKGTYALQCIGTVRECILAEIPLSNWKPLEGT